MRITVIDFWGLFNYGAALALILYGIYIVLSENHFMRKIIGMVILQTGVILFFITIAFKTNGTIPILDHAETSDFIDAAHYANPLPHALMLTAIVVGVSTLGVALVLAVSIFDSHQTLEEDEILQKIADSDEA